LAGALRGVGVDGAAVDRIVQLWTSERNTRSKEVTARMLCQWADKGLITAQQHRERLERLGYPAQDANRIARVCEIDSAAKKAAAKKKEEKEALAALRRNFLEEIKALRELRDGLTAWFDEHGYYPDLTEFMTAQSGSSEG
jgi:uncharacterized protein YnzC (UPF0291/DUF896 family)